MINDKAKNKLLRELEKGGNVYLTCLKTNINRSTYYRWKNEDKEFKSKADRAERQGRKNNCDIAEQALMLNVRDKKMDAIKYLLSHHSPRYKTKNSSNVIILHKKDTTPSPPAARPQVLVDIIKQAHQAEQERRKRMHESFISQGFEIPKKLDGKPIEIDEMADYEKYIRDWQKLDEEQKKNVRAEILSPNADKPESENEQIDGF